MVALASWAYFAVTAGTLDLDPVLSNSVALRLGTAGSFLGWKVEDYTAYISNYGYFVDNLSIFYRYKVTSMYLFIHKILIGQILILSYFVSSLSSSLLYESSTLIIMPYLLFDDKMHLLILCISMNHALRTGVLYTGLVTTALVPQWQTRCGKAMGSHWFPSMGPQSSSMGHPWAFHGFSPKRSIQLLGNPHGKIGKPPLGSMIYRWWVNSRSLSLPGRA